MSAIEARQSERSELGHEECIFCKIARGESLSSHVIAENDKAIAILALEGHPLVMPKEHIQDRDLIEERGREDLMGVFSLVLDILPHVNDAYNATGVNVVSNLGRSAGQDIPHVHIHLIPRREGDNGMRVTITYRPKKKDLPRIAESLRKSMLQRPVS